MLDFLNILINIISGMLIEIVYFTFFLIYVKNINKRKFLLFILIGISYITCIMLSRFKLLYYIGFIVSVYLILKLLYKNKAYITDLFIFSLSTLYLTLTNYVLHFFIASDNSNYYIIYILSRIMLLLPFIFKKKFNELYIKYMSLWNRNDETKRPIKSITLRNVSLIIMNLFIFLMNICVLIKTGLL